MHTRVNAPCLIIYLFHMNHMASTILSYCDELLCVPVVYLIKLLSSLIGIDENVLQYICQHATAYFIKLIKIKILSLNEFKMGSFEN